MNKDLVVIITEDIAQELEYAEARNDHRAVDVLRSVLMRIQARTYEHSAMQEAREDDWIGRINEALDAYEAMEKSRRLDK